MTFKEFTDHFMVAVYYFYLLPAATSMVFGFLAASTGKLGSDIKLLSPFEQLKVVYMAAIWPVVNMLSALRFIASVARRN